MAESDLQKVYRLQCQYLHEHLNIQELLPHLFTSQFISNADYEQLKRKIDNNGPTKAVEQFYEILIRKPGEDNFGTFVKCLQESNQQEIADVMRGSFNEVKTQKFKVYVQKDERKEKDAGLYRQQAFGSDRPQATGQDSPPAANCDKYAYCIRYYQPDYSTTIDDEEKIAHDFVCQLKTRFIERSKKLNLPPKEVYDDWQEVGVNRIRQIVRVVKNSHVVLLLFTNKFGENSRNNFTGDFACYKKLESDVVFPIGLLTHDFPDHLEFFSPICFNHDWRIDDKKWEKLLKGIFDKLKKDCCSIQCSEIENGQCNQLQLTHSPVQVSDNDTESTLVARASYGSGNSQNSQIEGSEVTSSSPEQQQQQPQSIVSRASTLYNSFTSAYLRVTEFLND